MTLTQLQDDMAAALDKEGIKCQVTFCRVNEFSLAFDTAEECERGIAFMRKVRGARLDDVAHDGECGSFAYYRF